jgi:ketosteroid isomerase-like protein
LASFVRNVLASFMLVALFCTSPLSASAQEKPLTADQQKIVDTVNTIFIAARADDAAKFDTVLAPGFYIFDGGKRFDGDAVMTFIKALHAAGKRYDWNVTEPDVHISGNSAWIAYVNQGSITDASGTTKQSWLESAFLQKEKGVWKIVFMHSTRVPPAAAASQSEPKK